MGKEIRVRYYGILVPKKMGRYRSFFWFTYNPERSHMVANGMVLVARIMTMESTALVSTIMTVRAAIGSGITRTGQSTVNWTSKRVVQGSPRTPLWQSVVVLRLVALLC